MGEENSGMPVIQKKICLLGDFAVGKTSLVRRFVEGRFDDKYLSTIGVKISRCVLRRPAGDLHLLVWDLAGGAEFAAGPGYMRGAAGALIVCDLTRPETLAALERYAARMRAVNTQAVLVFVGNKVDLSGQRAISEADLRQTCAALAGPAVLSSAKTGELVAAAFELLAERLIPAA